MELLSPRRFAIDNRVTTATSQYAFKYQEDDLDLAQRGHLTKLFIGTETKLAKPGDETPPIDVPLSIPSQETIKNFLKIQRLMNTCINNAEDIKHELHRIVAFIFRRKPELAQASSRYDFMKLKDTFTDYIKGNDKTRHLANKSFRRVFNQFVIDRNIYTHGKLMVRHDDNAFIILYQDNHTKTNTYATVDLEIIQSYYTAYESIRKMLVEFNVIANTFV